MFRRHLLCLAMLSFSLVAAGQSRYMVGYGQASLEPDKEFLSVALQGYGHPSQGRFSLEWNGLEVVDVNEPLSFIGADKGLYALALNGDLFCRKTDSGTWCEVGSTNPVVLLAGSSPNSYKVLAADGGVMYGVSLMNEVYRYDMGKSPMSWQKMAAAPDAVAMAAFGGKLYVVSADGVLHEGSGENGSVEFRSISKVPGNTYSMAAFRNRLYLLLDNQSIWEYDSKENIPWRMVAYLNGVTYREPLRYIAVCNDTLYGLGFDNRLFKASSRTEGNLSVRTLSVSDGKNTVLITGMDSAAIDYDFAQEMKADVSAKTGLSPDNMLINVSHSHFTPVSKNWFAFGESGIPDSRYLSKMKEVYVQSALTAVSNMKSGEISIVRGSADVGYNRGLSGADAVIDNAVDVALFDVLSSSERFVLFEGACHPVFPNSGKERFTISANWPGTARERVEKALPGVKSIFLQGCCGDINPLSQDYRQTGSIVAEQVVSAVKSELKLVRGKIMVKADSVNVQVPVMSREEVEAFKRANINRTGDIEAQKNVRWAEHMLRLYDAGGVPDTMPVYYQILDIGNWRIVALSREPVTEYALRIKGLFPKKFVTVLGYTGDVSSYLTSDVHVKSGNYESHDSFFWYGAPSYFPEGTIDQIIEKIKITTK